MSDDLTLTIGGKRLTGWTEVAVTRGIEVMPNSFVISATETSPIYTDAAGLVEGQPCTVSIGADKVITGYVDQVVPAFGPGGHAVQIVGRGKCQDLVDCAAVWKGCQVSGATALEIAQKLGKPYGVTAKTMAPPGPTVPQFNINVGDTPAEILELVTRHAGLLYYEDVLGDLVLSQVGSDRAASGFVQGQNVQAARFVRSMSQRYSEYVCSMLSIDVSGIHELEDGLFYFTAKDPNVPRYRRTVIVAEGVQGGKELAQNRANWEAARRAGRGRSVALTADSWRDAKGKLWTPNTLAPVSLPRLGLSRATWCLAEVTYRLGLSTGRVAEVLLMPPESFTPEPIRLQPIVGGVVAAPGTGG